MARRRLGYGRGPRQKFEQDELTLVGGVRHGRTLGSPIAIEIKNSEWFRSDKWHEEMSPAPGATKDPLTQVRPGPCRSRRDAEVRLHRRPRRARAGECSRDRGARRGRRRGEEAARPDRRRGALPRHPDGRGSLEGGRAPDAGRPRPRRRVAGALLRRGGRGGDDRRGQGGGEGRRLARRHRRGARLRRAGRPRQPRPLGSQARRAARPGDDEHPGGEGRRDRRRVRGRRPPRQRSARRDHVGRAMRGSTAARPRSPAAPRAA